MAKHTPFFGQTAQAKHRASLSTLNLAIRLLSSFAKSKFLKYFIFGLRTIFVPEIIPAAPMPIFSTWQPGCQVVNFMISFRKSFKFLGVLICRADKTFFPSQRTALIFDPP